MLLYWAALYSAVFLIFLPTLTNSHLACLGLTAEWCCCWFLNTTPLSVAALLLDNISHSIMHKVLYVERQIIDIKINSFNNQLMCHLVQLCRLVIQWVDCISPDSYVYWSSICFFFSPGWICYSEEKRFREANHRSHAAEGVPAQSPEWGPDWNAAQISSSTDTYAYMKLKPLTRK